MSRDIFDLLEEKTIAALEIAVNELTVDIGLKFRNDFLKSLPKPYATLCWHDGELQVVVSYEDTNDGFGDDMVKHVVELGLGDDDLSGAVFNGHGSFLNPEESKACATFLRKLADAIDA